MSLRKDREPLQEVSSSPEVTLGEMLQEAR